MPISTTAARADHRVEVVLDLVERQAAQAVVRAELDDDERRFVRVEKFRQARESAGGRFSADARVHDRPGMFRLLDSRFEQMHPARFDRDVVRGG
jgi:hypothetical protein